MQPRRKRNDWLIVALAIIVAPPVGVYGLLKFQDWRGRPRKPDEVRRIGPGDPPSPATFTPGREVPEQPPITSVAVVPAADAGARVTDDELVLGVVIDGEARAYPINMMIGPEREVFNDNLAGRPIAATFCHMCYDGIVYDRRVKGRTLTLAVSGLLWEHSLVMIDGETRSLWSQLLGKAMRGALAGQKLQPIPSVMTDWKEWRGRYPQTTVALLPRTAEDFRRGHDGRERLLIGLALDGRSRAWRSEDLREHRAANDRLGDVAVLVVWDDSSGTLVLHGRRVDGRDLSFEFEDGELVDRETNTTWDLITGEAVNGPLERKRLPSLPGIVSYDHAWMVFHPESTYWEP